MVAFGKIKPRKILVVGDLALDRYTHGRIGRISPEAPVPILNLIKEEERPGMSGNVALNLSALGQEVVLLGRVGDDRAGHLLCEQLTEQGIDVSALLIESVTGVKHRFIASNQQVLRVDDEKTHPLSPKAEITLTKRLPALLADIDAVAISDYGKGFCTPALLQALISEARNRSIPIIVDPKGRDFTRYSGATIIKPNFSEALLASNLEPSATLDEISAALHVHATIGTLLITRAEKGIALFPKDQAREDIPSKPLQVRDVTGAGDTVLSILTCALANGLTHLQAARLANMAASLAVQRFGCVPISLAELGTLLCEASSDKLFDEHHLAALTAALKDTPHTLLDLSSEEILTTALFSQIQEIKERGHKLVVQFKEQPAPLFLDLLASLEQVDFILVGHLSYSESLLHTSA